MAEKIMKEATAFDDSRMREDLRSAINRNSREQFSNTPDVTLADYLLNCLIAYERAQQQNEKWHSSNGG